MANHTGIYRHGNRWRVSVMRGGQRVTRVCDTLSEATLARDQLIHDLRLRSGKLPGRATVDDVLDLWLEHVSHAAPSRRQHRGGRLGRAPARYPPLLRLAPPALGCASRRD